MRIEVAIEEPGVRVVAIIAGVVGVAAIVLAVVAPFTTVQRVLAAAIGVMLLALAVVHYRDRRQRDRDDRRGRD